MMDPMAMQSLTGMPSGKKRRAGKRAHRGSGKGPHPHTHLANAKAAHAKGDHAGAKRHAFSFIKALPSAPKEANEPLEPFNDDETLEEPAAPKQGLGRKLGLGLSSGPITASTPIGDAPPAGDPSPSGAAKLAMMLRNRRAMA